MPAGNLIGKAEARFFSIKDNIAAVAALAVAGQCPLGPHVPVRLRPIAPPNEARARHDKLEARLGYRFADPDLLDRALTHSSAISPAKRIEHSYQRLEFLGDRVLGLVVADMLYRRCPRPTRASCSRSLNTLVRKETCAAIARELDLGSELNLGESEARTGGAEKEAILGDVTEAVIGAIYCDGGLGQAYEFVERMFGDIIGRRPGRPRRRQDDAAGMGAGQGPRAAHLYRGRAHRPRPCARIHHRRQPRRFRAADAPPAHPRSSPNTRPPSAS